MNKYLLIVKKSVIFVLLLCLLLVGINTISIKVNAASVATFSSSNVLVNKQLKYGISYRSVEGLSNTAGNTSYVRQVCNVIDIPSVEGLVVTSWANMGTNKWNMSHVNVVAKNYEETHPGYKVIAATNGDFYDINANNAFPRTPTGCEISDGNYFKSIPTRSTNYQVVSFTNDGSANSIVAYNQNVVKVNSLPTLAIYDENDEIIKNVGINKVNEAPLDGEISVFYGSYNSDKSYKPITVSGDALATYLVGKAIYCLPHSASDFYGLGVISGLEANELGNEQFAISSNNEEVNKLLDKNVKIRVQYEWNGTASGVKDAVNAGTQVLVNGAIASNANNGDGSRMSARHPRTAIGVKQDGSIVLMVNDGRQESIGRYGSYGDELAAMMEYFGCVNAYNLDGGGSSILYYLDGDELVLGNKYSDASERSISNIVLVAVKEPDLDIDLVEVGSRTAEVKVTVNDSGRHNISKILVKIEGVRDAEVVDGIAKVTGLSQLTRYELNIVYISANGKTVVTDYKLSFATTAKEYKIKALEIEESGDNYVVTLDYTDTGKSTTLATAKIAINGKEYTLDGGSVTIPRSDFDIVHELKVTFNVNTIDGFVEVTLVNPHAKFLNDLKESFDSISTLVSSIYK